MRRIVLGLVVAAITSCSPSPEDVANGDDPIAALTSTARSSRYGLNYWVEQRDQKTETWSQALAFCEPPEHANYPNCETVREVRATEPGKVEDPRTQPGFKNF
ncbi:MAG: hypothetical protein ACREI8_02870 [Myxococcota bacterium]